ncbi:MAG: hypothetical protein KTR16_01605 [Acidiferrobacterales bacterium]|nr:hypothetical protein [Acidiferrobacterales bacterium]
MLKNLLNHFRIFNTGYHFDLTATVFADFDVDVEDSLEALHPSYCHGRHVCRFCRGKNRSWRDGALRDSCYTSRYRGLPVCRAACPAWQASLERVGDVRNRLFDWAIVSPWRSLPVTWVSSA